MRRILAATVFSIGLLAWAGLGLAAEKEKAPAQGVEQGRRGLRADPERRGDEDPRAGQGRQGRRGLRLGLRRRADRGPGGQDPRPHGTGYDIDPQRIKECHENAKTNDVEKLVELNRRTFSNST